MYKIANWMLLQLYSYIPYLGQLHNKNKIANSIVIIIKYSICNPDVIHDYIVWVQNQTHKRLCAYVSTTKTFIFYLTKVAMTPAHFEEPDYIL